MGHLLEGHLYFQISVPVKDYIAVIELRSHRWEKENLGAFFAFKYNWDILSTCANVIGRPLVSIKYDTFESSKIILNIIQSGTMLDFTACCASNDLN